MNNCLAALVQHIKTGTEPDGIKTVAPYGKQFEKDAKSGKLKPAVNLSTVLPAHFASYIDGSPAAQEPFYTFAIITITETHGLNEADNVNNNLMQAAALIQHLKANPAFSPLTGTGTGKYWINNPEDIYHYIAHTENAFTASVTIIDIKDHTN